MTHGCDIYKQHTFAYYSFSLGIMTCFVVKTHQSISDLMLHLPGLLWSATKQQNPAGQSVEPVYRSQVLQVVLFGKNKNNRVVAITAAWMNLKRSNFLISETFFCNCNKARVTRRRRKLMAGNKKKNKKKMFIVLKIGEIDERRRCRNTFQTLPQTKQKNYKQV